MSKQHWLIVALAVSLLISIMLWRSYLGEEMQGFKEFPYTYLPADVTTTDAGMVIIQVGAINGPESITLPDGRVAWPAYTHPEILVDGQLVLFPMQSSLDGLTALGVSIQGKPLSESQLAFAKRYQTEKGQRMLDAFKESMQ